MSDNSWIRNLLSPKPRTIREARGRRLAIENLEARITPADLVYSAVDHTSLTLRLDGPNLQVVDTTNPLQVFASKPLSEVVTGVRIDGAGFNANLTIDASVPQVGGGVLFAGGSGTNTLVGPGRDTTWRVTGADEGHLENPGFVRFTGVEDIAGAAGNQDTFH